MIFFRIFYLLSFNCFLRTAEASARFIAFLLDPQPLLRRFFHERRERWKIFWNFPTLESRFPGDNLELYTSWRSNICIVCPSLKMVNASSHRATRSPLTVKLTPVTSSLKHNLYLVNCRLHNKWKWYIYGLHIYYSQNEGRISSDALGLFKFCRRISTMLNFCSDFSV